MVEIKVNIEEGDGCYYAHAIELIGCFAKTEDPDEAITSLLKDAKQYSKWLLDNDVGNTYKSLAQEILSGINGFKIVEEVKNVPNLRENTGSSALFESDKEIVSEEMFEFYITIINKLPGELLRIVFQYSDDERDDEILPGKNTINEELRALYQSEMFYISRFGKGVEHTFYDTIDLTKDELESLSILERVMKVRQGAIAVLRYYYPKVKETTFKSPQDSKFPDELWTIKKVIRKIIVQEREIISAIRQLVNTLEERKLTKQLTK